MLLIYKYYFYCGLFLMFVPLITFSQEIDCDNTVYLTTHISTGSGLYRFQVDTLEGITDIEELFVDNKDYHFGCLGYSVVDKMIYALEFNTYELLQINGNGEIKNLGVPNGLDTTVLYYSGEIFPSGRDFLVIGKNPAVQKDEVFYSIDVFDFRATPLSVISDGNVTIQDMTRDPTTGIVYGYDSQQNTIVNIGNGQVSNYQYPSIPHQFTALFFDQSGQLYGLGENGGATSRKFFSIDKILGEAEYIRDGPIGNDTDACDCPYKFQFFRKVTPKRVLPCEEITIEYSFLNSSGSARTNLRILDELPEELTITAIVENTNDFNTDIISGVGTNTLDVRYMEALLGNKSRIIIKAMVNEEAAGIISSQAVLENLPLALNPKMLSDNIETPTQVSDANLIEVLTTEAADFDDLIEYTCDNQSALITAPIATAESFLWSDGTTAPTLSVTQPGGIYWVEMVTDCATYIDSVEVRFNAELPYLDLGTDQIQDQGLPFSINYSTNISAARQYEWTSTIPTALSCTDCATPSIRLLEPASFSVTVTDQRGCTATDDIYIEVNKNKQIFGPTAFSPNGDGINDLFYFQGSNAFIEVFRVFDRWGNMVFETKDGIVNETDHAWRGQYSNRTNPDQGVFIWYAQVIYLDGTTDTLTGTVTLIK